MSGLYAQGLKLNRYAGEMPMMAVTRPFWKVAFAPNNKTLSLTGTPLWRERLSRIRHLFFDDRDIMRYVVKPVAKELGIDFKGFGWHSFRRTHLTVMPEVGATAFETRDQAGHTKLETTMQYVRTSLDRRTDAVQRLQARLLAGNAGIVRDHSGAESTQVVDSVVGSAELESATSTVSR